MMTNNIEWVEWVRRLMERELGCVEREVLAYPDDESLWKVVPGISNPGGTLALHLSGNLRHFIGAQLGASGYVRDRDAEFSARGASRAEVAAQVADARRAVHSALDSLDPARFSERFPIKVGGCTMDAGSFATHLLSHLGYHLGQLDYHRRIVTGSPKTVDAVSIPEVFGGAESTHA